MTEPKKNQKQLFSEVLEYVKGNEELENFINKKIEQLSKPKAMTAKQKENEVVKNTILETLIKLGTGVAIKDIQEEDEDLEGLSNQKMSAMLKKLIDEGTVEKTYVKGIANYRAKVGE